MKPEIKLYGTERCHKTKHYIGYLQNAGLGFTIIDVEESKENADELRALYENRKLNFPTITIGNKKLRNPSDAELLKWINKLLV